MSSITQMPVIYRERRGQSSGVSRQRVLAIASHQSKHLIIPPHKTNKIRRLTNPPNTLITPTQTHIQTHKTRAALSPRLAHSSMKVSMICHDVFPSSPYATVSGLGTLVAGSVLFGGFWLDQVGLIGWLVGGVGGPPVAPTAAGGGQTTHKHPPNKAQRVARARRDDPKQTINQTDT